LHDVEENLKRYVYTLSSEIGSRGYRDEGLEQAGCFIASEWERDGYQVLYQQYKAYERVYKNIYIEIKGEGSPERILIVGAHYDTVTDCPGADDNASGVAAILALSRLLKHNHPKHTIRLVVFPLEEPPSFYTRRMGSYQYARSLHEEGKQLIGMICLESIGYFSDNKESQHFPMPFFRWFYPAVGNFIAFISNLHSRGFLNRFKSAFKMGTDIPCESISTLSIIPGIDFSDHRSFWRFGYNAIMVTDTAFYRNPNYHTPHDTAETLDYRRMTEVVKGVRSAIDELANLSL